MAQYYTLEEAAKVLQMPAEELREKAKKKEVRAFQDRGNWRFLAQQIDEMARLRGVGSDAELQLGDLGARPPAKGHSDRLAVDFSLEDESVPLGLEKPSDKGAPRSTKSGPKSPVSPRPSGDSDVRLVLDNEMDFQIDLDSDVKVEPSGPKGGPKSSGLRPKGGRKSKIDDAGVRLVDKPSDSDVKLDPGGKGSSSRLKGPSKSPSDSDIRLQDLPSSSGKKRGPEAGTITEEIDLDAEEARQAAKTSPPKAKFGKTGAAPVLPTSSPFELSEHDLNLDEGPPSKGPKSPARKSKVEKDSSSDFELIPFDANKSSGELGSGEIPLLSDDEVGLGDLPTPNAGNSGINLQEPADSGISLESGGSDEIEFELSLDAGSTPKPAAPKSKKASKVEDDSSSEFELSLDESPTDGSDSEFELSLDEGSDEAVGLKSDEGSDSEFELTLDDEGGLAAVDEDEDGKDIFEDTNFDVPALDEEESGSQAVALDEEGDTDLEASDFEISLDDDSGEESESQVVALDEEEDTDDAAATIARPRKGKGAKAALHAEEDEEGLDLEDLEASGGRKKPRKIEVEDDEETDVEEDEDEVVAASAAPPAEWGALSVVPLALTVIVMFVVSLMGFELIQSMWGYHRPAKIGRPVIDFVARQFDETLPKD